MNYPLKNIFAEFLAKFIAYLIKKGKRLADIKDSGKTRLMQIAAIARYFPFSPDFLICLSAITPRVKEIICNIGTNKKTMLNIKAQAATLFL